MERMTNDRVEETRKELARRELARRDLIAFAWYTYRRYQAAGVHRLLAEYLEEVERYVRTGGEEGIGRLMVFMPPRHGKSELVSKRFPAWFLGRNPDKRVILSSCTGSLAYDFSRGVREIVKDTPFQAVFGARSSQQEPVLLSTESRAVDAWNIEGHRGGLVAAGVGGSIIGRGADLAVIDDPFKDRNDAESQATRDKVDAWYRSTLYTRLEEAGAIVLMHQRWHSDDLAGRLIRRMLEGGDRWEILSLPALAEEWAQPDGDEEAFQEQVKEAVQQGYWISRDPLGREPGEALWAGKFDREALDAIRANLGGYDWDALYQQRPRQLEGALIKANEIPVVDQAPEGLRVARYWDLAVSGRESADYIVGAKVGRSSEGRLYILDIARFPGPWADARPRMVATMQRDGAEVEQGIEVSGQQGGYFQELQRDEALAGVPISGVDPRKVGNKEVRANVWASRIEDGLVAMVRAPWNDDFIAEALAFPRGQHDDQVDAVSGAVQMLPAVVAFSDVPQAPDVRSRWDAFGEIGGAGFSEMARELSGHPSKGLG
jgi:predicted phage terminase large subunit-like protein